MGKPPFLLPARTMELYHAQHGKSLLNMWVCYFWHVLNDLRHYYFIPLFSLLLASFQTKTPPYQVLFLYRKGCVEGRGRETSLWRKCTPSNRQRAANFKTVKEMSTLFDGSQHWQISRKRRSARSEILSQGHLGMSWRKNKPNQEREGQTKKKKTNSQPINMKDLRRGCAWKSRLSSGKNAVHHLWRNCTSCLRLKAGSESCAALGLAAVCVTSTNALCNLVLILSDWSNSLVCPEFPEEIGKLPEIDFSYYDLFVNWSYFLFSCLKNPVSK
jgi:hypothetical protein